MKSICQVIFLLAFASTVMAQEQDSIPSFILDKITYPVLDQHPYMGVMDMEFTAMKYDPNLEYKIAFDLTDSSKDSTQLNSALVEVARIYNLHRANGVPKEKMKLVAVIHGGTTYSILTDEAYEKNNGVPNPNIPVIKALKEEGVDFYVCSQIMGFFNIPPEDIHPLVEVALSAKTALVMFDQMGYTYMNVNE